MTAMLYAYIFDVEIESGRDLDKMEANLYAIPGVGGTEFIQSFGDGPSFWRIEFMPPDNQSFGMNKTLRKLERAVKTRKVKSNIDSHVFSDYVSNRQREMHHQAIDWLAGADDDATR